MKIENLQQLEEVLLLCHRHSVNSIVIDGISLELILNNGLAKEQKIKPMMIDGRPMSEDEILFWSSEK